MPRMLRLFLPLTVVAASLVTAMIAAPSSSGIHTPLTAADATAMMQKTAVMQNTAVIAALLAVWMLAAISLTLLSGREIRYSSLEMRASALHCFALGLVAVTSLALTAIVVSYVIPYVSVPLLFALGVFTILTKIYGLVAVFHAVGTLVAGSRTREQLARRQWLRGDLAMVVIGVIVLGALRLIPIAGPVIWGLASVFGIGTALATKFGRREPWFLAWRPVES